MQIIVKPKNVYNLDKYIKMKANAFIFGMKDLSVSPTAVINVNSLNYLRKKLPKNIKIFVSIDKNIFDKDIKILKKTLLSLEYLHIDGILFYDFSILELKEELKLTIPLIWNQNFFVTNYMTCNYYKNDLNVFNAVISNEITLEDIKQMVSKTTNNFFINAFGYQLMAYSKRKLISNYFKYIKKPNLKIYHHIIDKNIKYNIKQEKEGTSLISSYILNTLNEINDFKKIGIKYIILDEKNISRKNFLDVLNIYNEAVNNNLTSKKLKQLDEKLHKKFNNLSSGFLYNETVYKVK